MHVSVSQVFRDHTHSVMTELIAAEITFTTCIEPPKKKKGWDVTEDIR